MISNVCVNISVPLKLQRPRCTSDYPFTRSDNSGEFKYVNSTPTFGLRNGLRMKKHKTHCSESAVPSYSSRLNFLSLIWSYAMRVRSINIFNAYQVLESSSGRGKN